MSNKFHFLGMTDDEKAVAKRILSILNNRNDLRQYDDVKKRSAISAVREEYGNLLDENEQFYIVACVEYLETSMSVHNLEGGKRKHRKRHTKRRQSKRKQSKRKQSRK